ncbi:TOG array regulator of axonemal microtubules protein 2-like [Lithobates pipiens]
MDNQRYGDQWEVGPDEGRDRQFWIESEIPAVPPSEPIDIMIHLDDGEFHTSSRSPINTHRNSAVRKCTAKHLLRVMELLGAQKLLCGTRESTDTFLRTLVRLVQDGQQDTRFYGRRMFSLVMAHPKFEVQMERLIPSHELRDLIATVKQKELSDSVSEIPSARSQRPPQKNSAAVMAQDVQQPEESITRPADVEAEAQESPVPGRPPVRAAEVTEQLKELSKLLSAKEYQSKMEGVTLLLERCKNNVRFVTSNITPIFDAFNPRMQDANKKVNQYALESAVVMIPILKDSLHHVLVPMVTVVTDNLNSKHTGIYTAAVTVLDTLMKNIGKSLLTVSGTLPSTLGGPSTSILYSSFLAL